MDLNSKEVVFIWTTLFADGAFADGRECLGYCVCDATQYLRLVLAGMLMTCVNMINILWRIYYGMDCESLGVDDARWREQEESYVQHW